MEKKMNNLNEVEGYEMEGYEVCKDSASRCKNDCLWPLPPHAFSYQD